MTDEARANLEGKLEALATELKGIVEWKWDGRFGTALGEFASTEKDQVLGILEQHLVSSWDSSSVKEAPDVVQSIVKTLGGLMSGQLLLLSDSRRAACVFCAWWPWGSGTKVSIRIAPFSDTLDTEALAELTNTFRGLFNI